MAKIIAGVKKTSHQLENRWDATGDDYNNWKTETKDSILAAVSNVFGRQSVLSSRYTKQKKLFQQLFRQTYKQEEDEALKRRKEDLFTSLQNAGETKKSIDKQVKKLKAVAFDKDVSVVHVVRFNKLIEKEIEAELIKSAKIKANRHIWNTDADIIKKQRHLLFIRDNAKVSMFCAEAFFQESDPEKIIHWKQFKTDVFYKFVDTTCENIRIAKQQIKIIERINQVFKQLQSEKVNITYGELRSRLEVWSDLFEKNFFAKDCFVTTGDVSVTMDEFLQNACDFKLCLADLYKLVADYEEEHEESLQPEQLTLANNAHQEHKQDKEKREHSKSQQDSKTNDDHFAGEPNSQTADDDNESSSNSGSDDEAAPADPTQPAAPADSANAAVVVVDPPAPADVSLPVDPVVAPAAVDAPIDPAVPSAIVISVDPPVEPVAAPAVDVAVADPVAVSTVGPVQPNSQEAAPAPVEDTECTQDTEDAAPASTQETEADTVTITVAVNPAPLSASNIVLPNTVELQQKMIADDLSASSSCALSVTQAIQKSLVNLEQVEQNAIDFFKNLLIRVQVETSKHLQLQKEGIEGVQKALDKNKNALFTSSSNKAKTKQELEAKLTAAQAEHDQFEQDSQRLIEHIKQNYRYALFQNRVHTNVSQVAENRTGWVVYLTENTPSAAVSEGKKGSKGIQSTTKKSKLFSSLSSSKNNNASDADFVLPVALECPSAFKKKLRRLTNHFDCSGEQFSPPPCVDYSSELHEVIDQPRNLPGFVYAVALIKEWQEFKCSGLTERLSTEFIVDQLKIHTGKAATAVNIVVNVCLLDALSLTNKIGLPRQIVYRQHREGKDHRYKYSNEEIARLHARAAEHLVDQVLLIKDVDNVRAALARYGPLAWNLPVYNSKKEFFWHNDDNDDNDDEKLNRKPAAAAPPRHTLVIVGYDDVSQTFLVRNSVGKKYGSFGSIRVAYQDLLNSDDQYVFLLLDHTQPLQNASADNRRIGLVSGVADVTGSAANDNGTAAGAGAAIKVLEENPLLIFNHPKVKDAPLELKIRDAGKRLARVIQQIECMQADNHKDNYTD